MTLAEVLRCRLRAAQGLEPCDLVLRDVRWLDVFTCAFVSGDVAIKDGVVVGLAPGLHGTREIEGRGAHVVPGFIDAHVHLESSLLVPENFQRAVLPRGTTTAVCDPHELANVLGVAGIQFFLDAAERMTRERPGLDLRVMASSCVPATAFETNGGGTLDVTALTPLLQHTKTLGLAEVMNIPGVLSGDPLVLDKIAAFDGRPVDGHAPLVRGRALSAYACAGITSCHESSELGEAQEKLRNGMAVWIREGSVAKDLDALAPLLTMATSTSVGFCTDDRNPLDIALEGHLDWLVRSAIKKGVPAEVAYRASSWSVARHYGLAGPARAGERIGAIAPGFRADLVVLDDVATCAIRDVLVAGHLVRETELSSDGNYGTPPNTVRAVIPEPRDLEGPSGMVHVIDVQPGRILTGRHVAPHDATGVRRLSVLERHGKGGKPANAYVQGFGEIDGAIGSSVGHDSHNLVVVGRDVSDMRAALACLAEVGGGFCVVRGGVVLARLALPLGGLMSLEDPSSIARSLEELRAASRAIQCVLAEPFLQLAFLSLPVIPSLKLTDRGLMDVDAFELIDVRAA